MMDRIARELTVFLLAVQFLTRIPVPARSLWSLERMAATPRWYPAVGLLVGGAAGLVFWAASLVYPPGLALLLSTAAGVLLTGAFHEDGFADACDGLGGGATRDRVLEIMRDSRLGTYGALGLGLALAGKILALAAMPAAAVPLALVAGHAGSRASSVLLLASSAYVRPEGRATPVSAGISGGGLALALATGAAAVGATAAVVPAVAIAGGLAGLVLGHLLMRRSFERLLGGYTGDCLGAVQQTSELGFYLGLAAWL